MHYVQSSPTQTTKMSPLLALFSLLLFLPGLINGRNGSHLRNNTRGPGGVQIGAFWDPAESATNEDWLKYQRKGAWLGCLLDATDENAGKAWPNFLNRNPPSIKGEWAGTSERTYIEHIAF
jgi:hypothetical protein